MEKLSDARITIRIGLITVFLLFVLLTIVYFFFGVLGVLSGLALCCFLLQIYKIVYQCYAARKDYSDLLVRIVTRLYAIYCLLNAAIITVGIFAYLLAAAQFQWFGWSEKVFFLIIVIVALVVAIIPYYSSIKQKNDLECNRNIIYDFVPRFVTLLFFVIYYGIKYIRDLALEDLLPAVFVIYLGIDRFVSLIIEGKSKAIEGYRRLYKNTEDWLKKKVK